ncbi:MAG: leucine-rich repeat domain-containing protein [Treponema sp.]|nr:leucine-rich repeat domain-containing protein [Treponema sp.]
MLITRNPDEARELRLASLVEASCGAILFHIMEPYRKYVDVYKIKSTSKALSVCICNNDRIACVQLSADLSWGQGTAEFLEAMVLGNKDLEYLDRLAYKNNVHFCDCKIPLKNIYKNKLESMVLFATSIADKNFMDCKDLKSVTFSSSVANIGSWAFFNCSSLSNITFSSGLKVIENLSFFNCKSLTDVELPSSVQRLGSHAFSNCSNLDSIFIPKSVNSINGKLLEGCLKLRTIYINEGSYTERWAKEHQLSNLLVYSGN